MNWRVSCAALVMLLFVTTVPAWANERAFLDVFLNGVPLGETPAIIGDHDILISQDIIEKSGLRNLHYTTEREGDRVYVSLKTLAPEISYTFDADNARVELTSSADHLNSHLIDLAQQSDSSVIIKPSRATYLNYSLTQNADAPATVSGQLGSNIGPGLFTTQIYNLAGRFHAAQPQYTIDDVSHVRRFIVGDSPITAPLYDVLGGSGEIAGIVMRHESELNPNALEATDLGFSGVALSPSTIDIFVNGTLISQKQTPPGRFSITNIPLGVGLNSATIVVHDAYGNTQTLNQSIFASPQLLHRGDRDYTYSFGHNLAASSVPGMNNPLAFVGNANYGVRKSVNAGGRLEIEPGLISTGVHAAVAAPLGQVNFSGALSSSQGYSGTAVASNYSYARKHFAFNAGIVGKSSRYASISSGPLSDRATRATNVTVSRAFGRNSVSLASQQLVDRDLGTTTELTLTDSFTFHGVSISIGKSRTITPTVAGSGIIINANYQLNATHNVNYSNNQTYTGGSQMLSLAQTTASGQGLNYELSSAPPQKGSLPITGTAHYAFRQGTVLAAFDGSKISSVNYSSALVYIDHALMSTRAIDGSYALIEAGVPNITARLNNFDEGKTDSKGRALASNLYSYAPNSVDVAADEAPLSRQILNADQRVTPVGLGGFVIPFESHEVHGYTGHLAVVRNGKLMVPSGGTLLLHDKAADISSEIGLEGVYYFENLRPGKYAATITDPNGVCAFTFTAPLSSRPVTKLKEQQCIVLTH